MPTPQDEPRWLSEREMDAWLPLVQLVNLLPQALDKQLRTEAGVTHVYYQVLAMLSQAPDQRMRMSELARHTATSLSRLSHAVSALEAKGWVSRAVCPEDGRGQFARLTDAGRELVEATAPGHVAEVRRLVFDRLSEEEVGQLQALAGKVLDGLVPRSAQLPRG